MIWGIVPLTVILYLIGGQVNKGVRRYGVPGIVTTIDILRRLKGARFYGLRKHWWKALIMLLFIPLLAVGYGVDSSFKKVFKKDWIVRIVYAIMLSTPLGIYTALTQYTLTQHALMVLALITAYSIRTEWLGVWARRLKIGDFDIIVEDVIRSSTLGICIVWTLL